MAEQSSDNSSSFSVYAHLTPTTHPDRICETLKLTLKAGNSTANASEESKVESTSGDSIDDLVTQVREFLTSQRNDGNKVYEILAVSPMFMGAPLPLTLTASSVLSQGSDVYVTVRITIDSTKHVKPLATNPAPATSGAASSLPSTAADISSATSTE